MGKAKAGGCASEGLRSSPGASASPGCPRRLLQIHQGIGAVVELVAAAALASAGFGRQQGPASSLLLIEIQGWGCCPGLSCWRGLVAQLVGEEAVEQHQGIGGGQLFAGDEGWQPRRRWYPGPAAA